MIFRSLHGKLDLIIALLRDIFMKEVKVSKKIDDLTSSVATIQTDFLNYTTAVDAKLAAITAAHEDDDGEAVAANVAALKKLHSDMADKIAGLTPAPAQAPAAADTTTGTDQAPAAQ